MEQIRLPLPSRINRTGSSGSGRGVVNTISSPLELLAQPIARAKYWDDRSN